MKINIFENFAAFQTHKQNRPTLDVSDTVRSIIEAVQQNKDSALRDFTNKFDGVDVSHFKVPLEEIEASLKQLSPELKQIFIKAIDNIRVFHERQKTETQLNFDEDGTVLGWKVTPIDSVGIYIPGGTAPLFSTLMMNVIPAQIAGVPRIALASPPEKKEGRPNGLPHPLILATVALLGIEEMYAIGGAQAIAAFAYGTESVPKVNKITGPGNAYVAEAKRQVYGIVGIESVAGPSDIMIVCDRLDIPTEYLVRDMLSQAEHDSDASAVLVTTSAQQASEVEQRLLELVPTLPRHEIIEASLENNSAIIIVADLDQAFEAVNEIAPEHLEVLTDQPFEDLHKIRNAGAIFLGPNTPEPIGDYFAGPNHTLPTEGGAKFSSPLGVQDFLKTSSVLHYSKARFQKDAHAVMELAKQEKLFAHAAAIQTRLT